MQVKAYSRITDTGSEQNAVVTEQKYAEGNRLSRITLEHCHNTH